MLIIRGEWMKSYNTIENEETSELVEKKSKFIANIIHINKPEEAEAKLGEIRKKILWCKT